MRSPENVRKPELVEEVRELMRIATAYYEVNGGSMRGAARLHVLHNQTIPEGLRTEILAALDTPPRRKRGRDKGQNHLRNLLIRSAVDYLCYRHGLHPTRCEVIRLLRDSSPSACSVAAEAFGMNERAVEAVWNKRGLSWRK